MRIGVTFLALLRGGTEIHIQKVGLQLGWLVTVGACDGTMSAEKWEPGGAVIEARQLLPRRDAVTRLATSSFSVLESRHAVAELPTMRVAVASSARQVGEAELRCAFQRAARGRSMTFDAGGRNVAAGQREARRLVLREREVCWPESLDGMAGFAAIEVGRGPKLSQVHVTVTIRALSKLDLEHGRLTGGDVAFGAGEIRVLSGQRIGRRKVFF